MKSGIDRTKLSNYIFHLDKHEFDKEFGPGIDGVRAWLTKGNIAKSGKFGIEKDDELS